MTEYTIEIPHKLDRDDPEGPIEITIYAAIIYQPSCGYFHHVDQIWTEPPIEISPDRETYFKDLIRELT